MICLVDERISEKCERRLTLEGFRVIKLPPSEKLSKPLASHPDMILFSHANNIIASAEYCERYPWVFSDIREYSNASLTFTADSFSDKYPYDAIFNALTLGNTVFMKENTISESIKTYAEKSELRTVNTEQGYPACTTLGFENSAITADLGMAKILENNGVNVTVIRNGDISLPPYEYGFIGGASGVCGNKIYFLGDISTHRDYGLINKAVSDAGYTLVSLSDEPLADLGRILFID